MAMRAPGVHGGDAQALTHGFEAGVSKEVFHGGWYLPKRLEFLSNVLLVGLRRPSRQMRLGRWQAEIFAGDVVLAGIRRRKPKAEGGA